jgi:hypothetical protein
MVANARRQASNPRSQRDQALRGAGRQLDRGGVNSRQNRLAVKFNAMQVMAEIPNDGATPADGQYMQDDSGASMHMVDSKAWCVLGYTTAVSIMASMHTAKSCEPAEELDAVCPLIIVFDGHDKLGKVSRIEFVGTSAVDFKGRYSRLLSRNGIEQDGSDRLLDNEVSSKRGQIIFNQSNEEHQVTVPMVRHEKASYVKVRLPNAEELEIFMRSNPQLWSWTVDSLMEGTIQLNKVTVRGRAHNALPHLGATQMGRLSASGAIEGMLGAVPMSGKDSDADEEIRDCEGCKAKQSAPARRNSSKPVPVLPGDLAVDIQQYPAKQVGTAALYGTVSVLLLLLAPI